jgi:hypothetical protein
MKRMGKPPACIQIDTDGLWVIFRHFGIPYEREDDPVFETAVPRFLELFDEFGIKAAFFAVGSDLRFPARAALLGECVRRGHEIANHSMNHREGFSFLSREEKLREIAEAETAIETSLGVKPLGFRAPSNDVDAETLSILDQRGYLYDSSLLPTFYGPLLSSLKFARMKLAPRHYLGRPVYGFAPRTPYNPDTGRIWKRGAMRIRELPITTMPLLRFPFHASFTLAASRFGLGMGLFRTGYALHAATRAPLNFVFHTNELCDPFYDRSIRRQFGLSLPLDRKIRLCKNILEKITRDFTVIPSSSFAHNGQP